MDNPRPSSENPKRRREDAEATLVTHEVPLRGLLRSIHDVSRLMIRAQEPEAMIQEACTILTRDSGLNRAWIALTNSEGEAWAFASSGLGGEASALEERIRRGGLPPCMEKLPEGRTEEPLVQQAEDCGDCSVLQSETPLDIAAFRLAFGERIHGAVCVAGQPALMKDKGTGKLLFGMANDLAMALQRIQVAEDQARTERALIRSNRRLRAAQEVGGLGDWDWDPATDTTTWSEHLYRLMNLDPSRPPPDFEGVLGLWHPDDRKGLRKSVERAMREGKPYTLELRRAGSDGEERVFRAEGKVEKDEKGEVQRLYGTILDITAGKRIEEKLAETAAILQAALDNSTAGIAIADAPDGRLRYINRTGLLISGGSMEEIAEGIGADEYVSSWQILDLDGTPLERDEVPLARAVLYGEESSREFVIRRADEGDRTVLANAAPVRNQEGEIIAGIVVFLDVTQRKEAEHALHEAEARYRSVFENTGTATAIVESDGIIRRANAQLSQMIGLPSEEIEGKRRWTEFADPRDLEWMKAQHELRRTRPESAEPEYECTLMDAAGNRRRILLKVDLIPGTDLSVASLLDITPLKETEEALRGLTHRALAIREEERERLGRELHDELGSILTGLRMDLSALRKAAKTGTGPDEETLTQVLNIADDATAFVRDYSAELRSPVLDLLGLGAAIEAHVEKLRARGFADVVVLIDDAGPRLSPEREINLFRIAQEILQNVVRHSKAKTVQVTYRKGDGTVDLEITDDGVGIPEEVLEAGTTMGIFGMRERATAIGAELSIQTLESGGTSVRVHLEI